MSGFEGSIVTWAVVGAGALVGVGARAMFSPRSRLLGPVVYRGCTDGPPRVALTFDDGPDPRTTPQLLDLLAARGVHATFFVIGAAARRWPNLLRRIHDEGHVIGNHSFHHHRLGMFRRRRYWEQELQATDEVIAAVVGRHPVFFRPPVGMRNPHLAGALRRGGYRVVTWTRSARDGLRPSVARVVQLARRARAGDILVLHDGCDRPDGASKEPTVAAMPRLLDGLAERGLRTACLSELIGGHCYR